MSYELIISEKPQAALKIATALADGKPKKIRKKNVNYYEITHEGKPIIVASAVGHLYGLGEKGGESWTYPVFETEWKPTYKINKAADYTKEYITVLEDLGKKASEVTVASDFDVEGEVIGLNVVRFATKRKDANRMKFSTLTKPDLIKSYKNKQDHLEWGQAKAGDTRHHLDWFYGINLSRAFTESIKKGANRFKVLSTGRVQAPTLHFLADRERKITAFKPEIFWEIYLDGNCQKTDIRTQYEMPLEIAKKHKIDEENEEGETRKTIDRYKIFEEEFKKEIVKETTSKNGIISDITKREFKQNVPTPFDLTSLQMEASNHLGYSPKRTLEIAQKLYVEGITSYPRTSSQKLPKELNLKNILSKLEKQPIYKEKVELVRSVNPDLKPNEGKKEDPAHPAIHPTGEIPKKLSDQERRVYDLIVKRFFSVFGKPALRETNTIIVDINSHNFILKGTRTIKRNWHDLYEPYLKFEDVELPKLDKGGEVINKKIEDIKKETSPPKRYSDASIIKELEKRDLGTKCLAEDTKVYIIKNNKYEIVSLKKLFDMLSKNSEIFKEKKAEYVINKNLKCISINNCEEVQNEFNLVSRRNLEKDEKVYEIRFANGAVIKCTQEHPILTYTDENFIYVKAQDLKSGMRGVQSTSMKINIEKKLISTWESFIEKANSNIEIYAKCSLKEFRDRKTITQKILGDELNLNQATIAGFENKKQVPIHIYKKLSLEKPRYLLSINKSIEIVNPFPIYYSPEITRILGNLVGDCSIDKIKIEKENCYDFRYHNTNLELINKFISDFKSIFNVSLKVSKAKDIEGHLTKYYVRIPALIGRIIAILFPEVIEKTNPKIPEEYIPYYIAGIFDDEGHAMKSEPKIFISHTNFSFLNNVKLMLKKINIESKLDKKQFKLYICGRENIENFICKIPIVSKNKKERIVSMLTSFYAYRNNSSNQIKRDILLILNIKKSTCPEIAKSLGLTENLTRSYLKKLKEEDFIKVEIKDIADYPRKVIYYELKKNILDSHYRYCDEIVLNKNYVTSTITSVTEIPYNKKVYDITNSEEIPNFTLGNSIVVHNSTRAEILNQLRERGYIIDKSIKVTELGLKMDEVLSDEIPTLVDEELTREFEGEMKLIKEHKSTPEKVLDVAKKNLSKILDDIKSREKEFGIKLADASSETLRHQITIAKCPNCEDGDLVVRIAKKNKSRFAGCTNYPNCKTLFNLPDAGVIKTLDEDAIDKDGKIYILYGKTENRLQKVCINEETPEEEEKELVHKKYEEEGMACPTCKKGKMLLRKSFYGEFLGCSNYPKCKTMMRIVNDKVDTTPIHPGDKKKTTKKK